MIKNLFKTILATYYYPDDGFLSGDDTFIFQSRRCPQVFDPRILINCGHEWHVHPVALAKSDVMKEDLAHLVSKVTFSVTPLITLDFKMRPLVS
jgi:hypothetical protein